MCALGCVYVYVYVFIHLYISSCDMLSHVYIHVTIINTQDI